MDGKKVRELRRRNGWTQAELASRLGTDAVTVSRWERSVSAPRCSAQMRLRELAGLMPSGLASLVRAVGESRSDALLRRELLLARRPPRRRFAADPTRRLRDVERARREQVSLKDRARLT